jgi:hypothetical protein
MIVLRGVEYSVPKEVESYVKQLEDTIEAFRRVDIGLEEVESHCED